MKVYVESGRLVCDLEKTYRCLSSAVLGGGLGFVRTWLDLQVPADYARKDPDRHLSEVSSAAGLMDPVVGMLTAAPVAEFCESSFEQAYALATVGVSHALAAAGSRLRPAPRIGTINMLVVVEAALSDAGLVGALQTAVEAKAQALASAGVRACNAQGFATGTATDSICIACPQGGSVPFAGPATRHGASIARAVYEAVLKGALAEKPADLDEGRHLMRERRSSWS